MSSNKILLTISVLISNRPDTVGKCLKSLDSLRSKVPSELILVDTGCGEAVRRIIEPYADKIVDFVWCNDFAKARNAGLKEARGEWFLYLDDDEWFENTKDIENFFLSGRHRQCNYGFYIVRNYRDPEGREYGDDYVGRLIRLYPDVQFVYSVHECFTNIRMPAIRLNSYVHHYGYVYENEEALRRHGRRNIGLLLAEHGKDPLEMHHILQLVQEYNALKEWEKVIELSRKGIQAADLEPKGAYYRGGFYGAIVRAFFTLKQYDQAVEIGEKFLGMEEPDELARACVSYFLCIVYCEMGEPGKSLEMARRYEEIYEKWKRDKESFLHYESLLTDGTFTGESTRQVLYREVRCGICMGTPGLAKKYFDKIEWGTQRLSVDLAVIEMIQDLVKIWLRTDADRAEEYTAMMKALLGHGNLAGVIVTDIRLLHEKSPELLETKKADWPALADKNWIFLYFKMKNIPETDREALIEDYRSLWRETKECLMRAKELKLWEMAQRDKIQMEQILRRIPVFRWKRAVEMAAPEADWQNMQDLQAHLQEFLETDSMHMMYWSIAYRMRKIRVMAADKGAEGECKNASMDGIVQELIEYAAESQKLCRMLYREELFREAVGLLPVECQLSLKIEEMVCATEADNMQKALLAVREALEIMPELSDALKCCAQWLSEKSAARNAEQESAKAELKSLAEAVKKQVRSMAAMGMLSEAAGVVCQLKAMVPEDGEVPKLEREIQQLRQSMESRDKIR